MRQGAEACTTTGTWKQQGGVVLPDQGQKEKSFGSYYFE